MINVPERVKKALFDKGWTQKRLCAEIDVTENGFKRMADNNTWKLETIEKIAHALNKPVAFFVDEGEEFVAQKYDSYSGEASGSNVLEEIRAMFKQEIKEKNELIATLSRSVENLVGKSEGVIEMPLLTTGDPVFDKNYKAYLEEVANQTNAIVVKPGNRRIQKLVAPRSQTARTRQ